MHTYNKVLNKNVISLEAIIIKIAAGISLHLAKRTRVIAVSAKNKIVPGR